MAGARKRLTKAVGALAATGVVQQAVRKAASDPRVRRKADEVKTAVRDRALAAGKAAAKKVRLAGKSAGQERGRDGEGGGEAAEEECGGPGEEEGGEEDSGAGEEGGGVGSGFVGSRGLLRARHPERSEGGMILVMPPSLRSG